MDRGAWRATGHRVAKSWTRLKQLSTHRSQTQPVASGAKPSPEELAAPGPKQGSESTVGPVRINRGHAASVGVMQHQSGSQTKGQNDTCVPDHPLGMCLLNHQARITEVERVAGPLHGPCCPQAPHQGPTWGSVSIATASLVSAITRSLLDQSRSLLTGLPGLTLAPRTTHSLPSSQGTLSRSQTALPDFPSCSEENPTPPSTPGPCPPPSPVTGSLPNFPVSCLSLMDT